MWEQHRIEPVVVKVPFKVVYKYDDQLFQRLRSVFRPAENHNAELKQLWLDAEPYHVQMGERDE